MRIGMILNGYGDGNFGRDGLYGAKLEAFSEDWCVVRHTSGRPAFAMFENQKEMEEVILKAHNAPPDEDWA